MIDFELPEIETLRRELEREFVTKKIKSTEAIGVKSLPDVKAKGDFSTIIEGATLVAVERRGLNIVMRLDNEHSIIMTIGENGRLEQKTSRTKRADDIVLVITFSPGGELRFADQKGTSAAWVMTDEDLEEQLPPKSFGIDLLQHPVAWLEFAHAVMSKKLPLKTLLTDPELFVGIGDIYSNEILFDAGLRYDRPSHELSNQDVRRLNRSVSGVLHDAVKYGGTSLEERPFTNLAGEPGEFAEHLAVYGKDGDLSPRSREPIRKGSYKKQVVYYCNTQI